MLIGLLTLGLLIVGLAQWPKSETPAESAAKTDAETNAPGDEPDTETTPAPVRTTVQPSSTQTNDRDQDDDDADSAPAPPPPGPLLGEATGLGLVTVTNRGLLQLTDLDTAETVEYAVRGQPAGVIGSKLIVQSDNGNLHLVDLNDPDADRIDLGRSPGLYQQVVSVEADVVWVLSEGPTNDLPVFEAYDADGDLVEEFPLQTDEQAFSIYSGGGSADLVQSSGGIYQREGTGYRLVANGSLLTSSAGLALVRSCDERMMCQAAWYDRSSWDRRLDAPVPDLPQRGQVTIAGADRWLIQTNWTDGATTVTEIATGRVARRTGANPTFYDGLGVPISPDGRWLLDRKIGRSIVVDMDNDLELDLDLGAGFRDGSHAVFVDMDALDLG